MSDDNGNIDALVRDESLRHRRRYVHDRHEYGYGYEESDESDPLSRHGHISRLLERTNAVAQCISAEVDKENELVEIVEQLLSQVASDANKRKEEDRRMEHRITMDSSRSSSAKLLHEELTEEFMEFCKWHFVEPRFNIVWRALNKIGLYLRVFLSFIFVFPFIAIYSKALRFFRRRIRVKRSNSNHSGGRPGWTIQRPHESGTTDNDFGTGLSQLVSNPLRFSGHSLRDELESMGNFSSENDETEQLRRFVVGTNNTNNNNISPNAVDTTEGKRGDVKTEVKVEMKIVPSVDDVVESDIEASSPPVSTQELKRRSKSRDKTTTRFKEEPTLADDPIIDGIGNGGDKRSRSGNVDVPALPDGEVERASWATQDNEEEEGWVDRDSQNSKDFWDSFGVRSRRSSRS